MSDKRPRRWTMLSETREAIDQYRADVLRDEDPHRFLCGAKSPLLLPTMDVGRARIHCSRVPEHRGDHAFTSTTNRTLLASWTTREVPLGRGPLGTLHEEAPALAAEEAVHRA